MGGFGGWPINDRHRVLGLHCVTAYLDRIRGIGSLPGYTESVVLSFPNPGLSIAAVTSRRRAGYSCVMPGTSLLLWMCLPRGWAARFLWLQLLRTPDKMIESCSQDHPHPRFLCSAPSVPLSRGERSRRAGKRESGILSGALNRCSCPRQIAAPSLIVRFADKIHNYLFLLRKMKIIKFRSDSDC